MPSIDGQQNASTEALPDPRRGDLEDDASSTKSQSLLALAGTLFVEISLPRLVMAWLLLLVIPGLLLGIAPIAASVWVSTMAWKITYIAAEFGAALLLALVIGVGWFGWRPLFRMAESSFWSLNSLIIQPIYATFRELLRHLVESWLSKDMSMDRRASLRSVIAGVSGLAVSGLAVLAVLAVWPHTHLWGGMPDVGFQWQLVAVIFSNSVALICAYLAVASFLWGIADATMSQPRDLEKFHEPRDGDKTWRVAHLSDLHVVGERYGFRMESGRTGPQGNQRWMRVVERLADIHATAPLDIILITGDMTDAGRSAEWAEFEDALAGYPQLAERTLMLPGNHDVNIVDRANPARLDLPTSPNRRLRLLRSIAALARMQGGRVLVMGADRRGFDATLSHALRPHLHSLTGFMTTGSPRLTRRLPNLWNEIFPMVLPPAAEDGLGIILLNSNAITHFSFTNALGMISAEQAYGIDVAMARFPRAKWIVALHHHVVEYPRAAKALSERIGTALINGNWFARRLQRLAGRAVVMHGHRHIDWIGECAGIQVVSAPSPVMESGNGAATYFYVHTLAATASGQLRLQRPEAVTVEGSKGA